MIYKGQANLIQSIQRKDINLWNFLNTIDMFLLAIGNSGSDNPQIAVCKQNNFPKLFSGQSQFVYVSDYGHLIYWDGVNANFCDGGNDFYCLADTIPSTIGWVQVAGQSISYLTPLGLLVPKTLLNTTATSAFLKATNTTPATFTSPVAAKITGNVDTNTTGITDTTAVINNPASGGTAVTVLKTLSDPGHNHVVNTVPGTLINDSLATPESFNSKLWYRL